MNAEHFELIEHLLYTAYTDKFDNALFFTILRETITL